MGLKVKRPLEGATFEIPRGLVERFESTCRSAGLSLASGTHSVAFQIVQEARVQEHAPFLQERVPLFGSIANVRAGRYGADSLLIFLASPEVQRAIGLLESGTGREGLGSISALLQTALQTSEKPTRLSRISRAAKSSDGGRFDARACVPSAPEFTIRDGYRLLFQKFAELRLLEQLPVAGSEDESCKKLNRNFPPWLLSELKTACKWTHRKVSPELTRVMADLLENKPSDLFFPITNFWLGAPESCIHATIGTTHDHGAVLILSGEPLVDVLKRIRTRPEPVSLEQLWSLLQSVLFAPAVSASSGNGSFHPNGNGAQVAIHSTAAKTRVRTPASRTVLK